jgi:hypothetical protein
MNMPGFNGDASLYKSAIHYRLAAQWGDTAKAFVDMARVINGGSACRPGCARCLSDISSPTGCSTTCQTAQCEPIDKPCRGCANPCEGGVFCGGVCTDPGSDPSNCGSCGHACPGGMVCSKGVCVCAPGLTNCNDICTNTSSDSANCGACGNSCGSDPCLGGPVSTLLPRQASTFSVVRGA